MNKIEDFILERINTYDKAQVWNGRAIDEITQEEIDCYKTDFKLIDKLVAELDLTFNDKFCNTHILYRRNQLDKWTPYLVKEMHPQDAHNGMVICQHIGKNLKMNNHKNLYVRKGEFKSISELDLMQMYKWHKTNEGEYKDKFLYVFKNELGRIKIGQAKSVEQRNQSIKIQAGISIEILNIIESSAKYENRLHKIFKHKKYAGEWFNLFESELNWLCCLNVYNIDSEIKKINNL